jgi:hypothetical protein
MTPDTLFLICNFGVIPFWLLLALAPGWRPTQAIVHAAWIPLALATVYVFAITTSFADAPEGGSFGSLAGVMAFFTSPWATLAGWVHYLAFDLFIGAWQVRDSRRRGLAHIVVLPCLFFTLMFGPVGLGLYLLARLASGRGAALEEAAGA